MNINSLNTLLLVYIAFGVIAIAVLLLVFLGNKPTKKE